MVQPLWKRVWRLLKKLQRELPYDPENSLLGIYLKEMKTYTHLPVRCSLIYIAKTRKQPKCPSMDECIKKMQSLCPAEYYPTVKKKETLPFEAIWMDPEGIMLSEIQSQADKDKYCKISLTCGI